MTSSTKVGRLVSTLPLKLTDGWNDIQINLAELTQRLYATQYVEATRLQVRDVRDHRLFSLDTCIAAPISKERRSGAG